MSIALLGTACERPRAPQPDAAPPPITGEQLDRIEQGLRARREPRALWSSVERTDDETRLVVHSRINEPDPEERARICATAAQVIRGLLQPGQSVELYLVLEKGVHACR